MHAWVCQGVLSPSIWSPPFSSLAIPPSALATCWYGPKTRRGRGRAEGGGREMGAGKKSVLRSSSGYDRLLRSSKIGQNQRRGHPKRSGRGIRTLANASTRKSGRASLRRREKAKVGSSFLPRAEKGKSFAFSSPSRPSTRPPPYYSGGRGGK